MNSKRALVIGGNRFFGRHLTLALLDAGYRVTLLTRGKYGDGLGDRVTRIRADRRDESSLGAALRGKTWGLVFDQICFNVNEARAICKILSGKTERVLFTSSQSIYGYGVDILEENVNPLAHCFSEDASPDEDYAEAKRQAESVFARHPNLWFASPSTPLQPTRPCSEPSTCCSDNPRSRQSHTFEEANSWIDPEARSRTDFRSSKRWLDPQVSDAERLPV